MSTPAPDAVPNALPAARPLDGRVALVTGAGSGIGRAAALALARAGVRVVLGDVTEDGLAGTRTLLRDAGLPEAHVRAARADVRDDAQVAALVALAVGDAAGGFGRLDFAVNSAGVGGVEAPAADYPEDDWGRTLDVNLTGVWRSMRHEIPAMLATVRAHGGTAAVVNVASVAGVNGFPQHAAYAASKHGVVGLTRTAALEYARAGLRINALCPGFTDTPMVGRMTQGDPAREARLAGRVPLGRLGTVDEIAAAVVYLCSDAAAFMIGQTVVLDGGITAS